MADCGRRVKFEDSCCLPRRKIIEIKAATRTFKKTANGRNTNRNTGPRFGNSNCNNSPPTAGNGSRGENSYNGTRWSWLLAKDGSFSTLKNNHATTPVVVVPVVKTRKRKSLSSPTVSSIAVLADNSSKIVTNRPETGEEFGRKFLKPTSSRASIIGWFWLLAKDGSFATIETTATTIKSRKRQRQAKSSTSAVERSASRPRLHGTNSGDFPKNVTANGTIETQKGGWSWLLAKDGSFATADTTSTTTTTTRAPPKRKTNARAKPTIGTEQKHITERVHVLKSFAALDDYNHPLGVHSVILGTLPSNKSCAYNLSRKEIKLRGGSGPQNYGHSRNSFWNITGSALGFRRHRTPFRKQVRFLTDRGYAVWDVLSQAKRNKRLVKGSLVPTDLPRFVFDHPKLNRFVFAAKSAEVFCKFEVWGDWLTKNEATTADGDSFTICTKFWIRGSTLNPSTFEQTYAIFGKKKFEIEIVDDPTVSRSYSKACAIVKDEEDDGKHQQQQNYRRLIELIVLPSTSPANASMRPPEKEKIWHSACYRLEEPPSHYVCPGCEHHRLQTAVKRRNSTTSKTHWFQDCPYRENWKISKKKRRTKKPTEDDGIDPFYWYA